MNWQDFLSRSRGRQATILGQEPECSDEESSASPRQDFMAHASSSKGFSEPDGPGADARVHASASKSGSVGASGRVGKPGSSAKVVEQPLRIQLKDQVMGAEHSVVTP